MLEKISLYSLFGDIACGNIKNIKSCLENGIDVNARGNNGITPLMFTAGATSIRCRSSTHVEVVKFLLKNGADVNLKDNFGCTALLLASRASIDPKERIEIIKCLIENNADISMQDDFGNTVLINAASYYRDIEIVKLSSNRDHFWHRIIFN